MGEYRRISDTLQAAIRELDVANAAVPFMGYGEGRIAGAPVRVLIRCAAGTFFSNP